MNERIAEELRKLLPEDSDALSALAQRAGIPRQLLTTMLNGRALTIENVDRFLRASGASWSDLMRRSGDRGTHGRPLSFFRYQRHCERSLENLTKSQVYLQDPTSYNDPLDCALSVWLRGTGPEVLAKALWLLPGNPKRYELDTTMSALEMLEAAGKIDPGYAEIRAIFDGPQGVCCLSGMRTGPAHPLMWSHYADQHRGFCLQFDSSAGPFSTAEPIDYVDSVLGDGPEEISQSAVRRYFYYRKQADWEYEDEWRLLGPVGPMKYERNAISAVYLGFRTDERQKAEVREALGGGEGLAWFKMVPDSQARSLKAVLFDPKTGT